MIVEFSVDFINTFEWNEEAYQNLVIPPGQKSVLTCLAAASEKEKIFSVHVSGIDYCF